MEILLALAFVWIVGGTSGSFSKHQCVKDVKQCEAEVLEQVNSNRSSADKVDSIEEWRQGK